MPSPGQQCPAGPCWVVALGDGGGSAFNPLATEIGLTCNWIAWPS